MTARLGFKPKVPADPMGLADPRTIREWQKKKNMKVFSFVHPDYPYVVVDIMTEAYLNFDEAYRRRKKITSYWGAEVAVASMGDLITLKKIAGREQDLSDIAALRRLKK